MQNARKPRKVNVFILFHALTDTYTRKYIILMIRMEEMDEVAANLYIHKYLSPTLLTEFSLPVPSIKIRPGLFPHSLNGLGEIDDRCM